MALFLGDVLIRHELEYRGAEQDRLEPFSQIIKLMNTSRLLLFILAPFLVLSLIACGEGPSAANSPSDSAQSYPQLKTAEDFGYVNEGYLCAQVVTAMYKSNFCVIASDSCQGAYLESKGFKADAASLCELAQ